MFTNIDIILRWIARHWYPSIPRDISGAIISWWIIKIRLWIITSGVLTTIKRIKIIRLTTTRYICQQPLLVNDVMVGVTKDGFAKTILPLKDFIDSKDPQQMRFVLTLLGVSRSFPCPVAADYSSITAPFTGTVKTIDNDFVELFVRDFTGHFNPLLDRPKPSSSFLSMKAGPAGGPAILSAALAAANFTGVNLWGLAQIGGDRFMAWVKDLKSSVTLTLNARKPGSQTFKQVTGSAPVELRNRRFISVYDPEAKHRIVASYDYISQFAFQPFSQFCFDTLRRIPNDRTYTQDPYINMEGCRGMKFHSFDLDSATDRFPVQLQQQLITEIAGPAYAAAWKSLMVSEPFLAWIPEGSHSVPKLLKYSVGQPMGARSSWAVFTLSHHMVVQYAAYLEGVYPFKDYILLGDDIVIYHTQVAERYLAIIESLGVKISKTKSHVSFDTYEFAKRWFHKGIEISPIPISGFVSNWSDPKLLYQSVYDLYKVGRGPRSTINSISLTVSLISSLRRPKMTVESGGFYEFWDIGSHRSLSGFYKIPLAYTAKEIKRWTREFGHLNLVLRNLNQFDYELTRAFFANATKANEYIIPSNEATLIKEWIRTSSGVVNGMAMAALKKLSKFYSEFKEAYVSATEHSRLESTNVDISKHPLTWAVYKSVNFYHAQNKAMGYTTDLNSQLETITLLDPAKLLDRDREAERMIFLYSTLGRKLANQLSTDHDLIISKARTMQFGRALLDIKLLFEREYRFLKTDTWY